MAGPFHDAINTTSNAKKGEAFINNTKVLSLNSSFEGCTDRQLLPNSTLTGVSNFLSCKDINLSHRV